MADFAYNANTNTTETAVRGFYGSAHRFRMRGFDTNVAVNDWVYWYANHIDPLAQEYRQSAGPVTRITVVKVLQPGK